MNSWQVGHWRMEKPCATCPFNEEGPGRERRDALPAGRFEALKAGLLEGDHFHCVETGGAPDDDDTPWDHFRVCAGALDFQHEHHAESQFVRACERLDELYTADGSP